MTVSSAALTLPRRSVASGSSIQDRSTSMNPPMRNRLTDSGVRLATVVTTRMPCSRDLLTRGREFGAEGGDDTLRHRARHDVAVHRTMVGGEIEERQDAGARVAGDIRGCRREGGRECIRDGVVAVPEVLVEHLATDLGTRDDVADRQLVDRTLMGECERCVAQPGADPFRTGIDTVGACCHIRSVNKFVDK